MQKVIVLLAIVGIAGLESWAQTKKHFVVKDESSADLIKFYLKASSGTCEIRTRKGEAPINILGNSNEEYITSDFGQEVEGQVQSAWLTLKDSGKEGFGSKISKIFGKKTTDDENYWNIYLTDQKPYKLDLNYGVGKGYVDLSDVAVKICRINSGNAHVKVGYLSNQENRITMDTMVVSMDMGDVEIVNLDMAHAKNILAEVGFGTLRLGFNNEPIMPSDIWVNVGAGSLYVSLPLAETPVMIRMKGTSYSKYKVPEGYKKVRDNVYVSSSYSEGADNLLTFNIDLSMGSVVFGER